MTLRVGVFGVGGRMGIAVAHAVTDAEGLDLVAAVDPSFATVDVGEVTGVEGPSLPVAAGFSDLDPSAVDVMVDFTHIEAARQNLVFCAENGIHAVVGTSGFTEDEFDQIGSMFDQSNCLIAPNFAIGAVLMMRFGELAAPYFDTTEIIELHHEGKRDSPSGTAVSTAERMAAASSQWLEDPNESETIPGARGAEGPAGIRIHSVRMRGLTAHQEIVLGAIGQTLTIRHDSYDRSSFMPGVVLAVRRIADMPGLTVGLDAALGL